MLVCKLNETQGVDNTDGMGLGFLRTKLAGLFGTLEIEPLFYSLKQMVSQVVIHRTQTWAFAGAPILLQQRKPQPPTSRLSYSVGLYI